MCGISGFVSTNGTCLSGQKFYKSHRLLSHRGPDDEGFFGVFGGQNKFFKGEDTVAELSNLSHLRSVSKFNVILGHSRLSVIDLSVAGHQPFRFGSKILAFNGEIYNYRELRAELQTAGVQFQTESDTEVLIKAISTWGDDAFPKLNGMWALAFYCLETGKLMLSRDRFGVKPLYYANHRLGFFFASEIKVLKSLIGNVSLNEKAIFKYVRYNVVDDDSSTFFNEVKQLPVHSIATLENKELRLGTYSDGDAKEFSFLSFRDVFLDAVGLRMRADVEFGALLSGGLDSSLIVGAQRDLLGADKIKTFSAVFDSSKYSEKNYIDQTANWIGFLPSYIYPKASDVSANIEELILAQELPFRSMAVLSQFLIYKHIQENSNVKVLLNGQGADESFAGYDQHLYALCVEYLLKFNFNKFMGCILALSQRRRSKIYSTLIQLLRFMLHGLSSNPNKHKIFKKKYSLCNSISKPSLRKQLDFNFNTSPLKEYLRYEDRNSSWFGLEARLPFLDYRLVAKARTLRSDELVFSGKSKSVLKGIADGLVLDQIISRNDKMGFISPQEEWQKTELARDFDKCFSEIRNTGLFDFMDEAQIYKIYRKYTTGKMNDWSLIWRLYCLFHWKKVWWP